MRINGLVVVVGKPYVHAFLPSWKRWCRTLDALTVVTNNDEPELWDLLEKSAPNLGIYRTDIFTRHGAFLNKGAALAQAFAAVKPTDWVLNIDADVIPPEDWRVKAEPIIQVGNLYGCKRIYQGGALVNDPPPFPYGFFHLWNVKDPRTWSRPLWDLHWPSAGHYEVAFLERWPLANRIELPFQVVHPQEPRKQWFGQSPEAMAKMADEIKVGHHQSRVTKHYVLNVPDFACKVTFVPNGYPPESVVRFLNQTITEDPFEVSIVCR